MKNSILFAILFTLISFNQLTAQKKEVLNALSEKNKALNNNEIQNLSDLFHEKGTIRRFPKEKIAKGTTEIHDFYKNMFTKTETYSVTLLDRIVFKGTIIDKELVKANNLVKERIVFYKFKKSKIKSMTILQGEEPVTDFNDISIIDKQLEAYNRRSIEDFVKTYSSDVKLYRFPGRFQSEGHYGLRNDYSDFFKNTTDLNCKILKRMVMGNIVIDHEEVFRNGNVFKAVAIYEVENGLICRVNFIQ